MANLQIKLFENKSWTEWAFEKAIKVSCPVIKDVMLLEYSPESCPHGICRVSNTKKLHFVCWVFWGEIERTQPIWPKYIIWFYDCWSWFKIRKCKKKELFIKKSLISWTSFRNLWRNSNKSLILICSLFWVFFLKLSVIFVIWKSTSCYP